jgi:signal transduction histidine kinase
VGKAKQVLLKRRREIGVTLDAFGVVCVALVYVTGEATLWLHLAYISLALGSFVRTSRWSVIARSTAVTAGLAVWYATATNIKADDYLEIPLMYVLSVLFGLHSSQLGALLEVRAREGERLKAMLAAQADAAQARRENEAKSRFLAVMSHELRTPLNSILGFAQLLQQTGDLRKPQLRQVHNIQTGGEQLLRLVDDVLDLTRVASGSLDMEIVDVELRWPLQQAFEALQPTAARKGIAMTIDVAPDLRARVDRLRIQQVVIILLSNALKFTPDGGWVSLRAAHGNGDTVLIDVTDSGIGIRREDIDRIFEDFVQVDGGHSREQDGAGLGLPLCRSLLELMGSRIEVDSEFGVGSVFRVTTPVGAGRLIDFQSPSYPSARNVALGVGTASSTSSSRSSSAAHASRPTSNS